MKTDVDEKNLMRPGAGGYENPLHPLLSARKSPRAFTGQPVEPEKLRSLLEAARWAPSAGNMQPWRFIVAVNDRPEEFERMVDLLFDGNKIWAGKAPVLILTVAQVIDTASRRNNKFAFHDVGMATENLALQAVSLGVAAHVMGGFHADRAITAFNIPSEFEPVAMIALGYEGEARFLPQPLLDRELAARVRKPLSDFVFSNSWEIPADSLGSEPKINLNNTTNN